MLLELTSRHDNMSNDKFRSMFYKKLIYNKDVQLNY